MKLKLTLTILSLLFISVNSLAQLSTLINSFKTAYAKGDVNGYINNGEYIVSSLSPEEKHKGQRILTLFKVLTGKEQDMSTSDFNKAMYDVDLSSTLERNINSDLALINIKLGAYRSHLVFNQSKKLYKFRLKGIFKTATQNATNNFDGGIYEHHCRIVNYTTTPYNYSVVSVTEIPTIF